MKKTRLVIIIAVLMLITIFGACIVASADGPGIIRVQVKFMGISIPDAEV